MDFEDDEDWNKPVRLVVDPARALYVAGLRGVLAARTFEASPARGDVVSEVAAWARRPEPGGLCLYGLTHGGKTSLAAAAVKARWRQEEPPRREIPVSEWAILANTRGAEEEWRRSCEDLWKHSSFAPVLFTSWTVLEHQLRLALSERRFDQMLEALEDRVGLLVVDDLDTGSHTPWRESVLLSLLERPWRERRVIVTLNQNPVEGSELLTDRLVSRLNNPELFLKLEV